MTALVLHPNLHNLPLRVGGAQQINPKTEAAVRKELILEGGLRHVAPLSEDMSQLLIIMSVNLVAFTPIP
jgi:hypothetical protein